MYEIEQSTMQTQMNSMALQVYYESMENRDLPPRVISKLWGGGSFLEKVHEKNDGWIRVGIDDPASKRREKRRIAARRRRKRIMRVEMQPREEDLTLNDNTN